MPTHPHLLPHCCVVLCCAVLWLWLVVLCVVCREFVRASKIWVVPPDPPSPGPLPLPRGPPPPPDPPSTGPPFNRTAHLSAGSPPLGDLRASTLRGTIFLGSPASGRGPALTSNFIHSGSKLVLVPRAAWAGPSVLIIVGEASCEPLSGRWRRALQSVPVGHCGHTTGRGLCVRRASGRAVEILGQELLCPKQQPRKFAAQAKRALMCWSSAVDFAQWVKGAQMFLRRRAHLHSRTQCAGILRPADAIHWTTSSHNEKDPCPKCLYCGCCFLCFFLLDAGFSCCVLFFLLFVLLCFFLLLLSLLLICCCFCCFVAAAAAVLSSRRPLKNQSMPAFDLPKCLYCLSCCLCCFCCCFFMFVLLLLLLSLLLLLLFSCVAAVWCYLLLLFLLLLLLFFCFYCLYCCFCCFAFSALCAESASLCCFSCCLTCFCDRFCCCCSFCGCFLGRRPSKMSRTILQLMNPFDFRKSQEQFFVSRKKHFVSKKKDFGVLQKKTLVFCIPTKDFCSPEKNTSLARVLRTSTALGNLQQIAAALRHLGLCFKHVLLSNEDIWESASGSLRFVPRVSMPATNHHMLIAKLIVDTCRLV